MRILKLTTAVLLAGTSVPVLAQAETPSPAGTADDDDSGVIIVTARKREENLQDVPLTIAVVNATTIEKANLDNVSDLAMQTPGFSYKQGFGRVGGGGGAGVRPSIRGMSSVVGAPNAAFFVDGVFVSDNIASYQLDNLERVEVIKGPQSALFGRQTFSGAVNYVTRKPSDTLTGRIKATIAEYETREISGYISGPIVQDILNLEVNARFYRFGGDYLNNDLTPSRPIGAQRSFNLGARLLFKPSDNFDALLSVGASKDRDNGYVYNFQGSARNNCFAPPLTTPIGATPRTLTSRRGFFCGEVKTPARYTYNDREIEDAGFHALDRIFYRTSLAMSLRTDSGWGVASITAYNRNNSITGQDNSLIPTLNAAFAVDQSRTKDFSQELKIFSPVDAPIRGFIGAYYYKDDQLSGFQFTNTNRSRRTFNSEDGVESKSVFAMLEADIGEKFTAGLEGRYQTETITGSTEVLAPVGSNNAVPPPVTGIRKAKFNAFLPRLSLRYEPSDDLTLHATVAKGNKPGGFNNFPADARQADLDAFAAQGFDLFDEESAWSYEIGAKGRLGRINYSVAGFFTDWSSQQLSRGESYIRTNGTPNSVVFIQNAGQSEIKGFEIDVSGKPADWLFLRFGYTYVDARFTEFYDDTTEEIYDTDGRPGLLTNDTRNPADLDQLEGDLKGNKLPQTPTHQLIATAQITAPYTADTDFFIRSDLAYESKRFSQVDNLNWAGDSYNMNLSMGVEHPNWSVTFFARNLLDDKTPLVVTRLLDFNRALFRVNPLTGLNGLSFFRDFAVSAPRRRQFGLTFSYTY